MGKNSRRKYRPLEDSEMTKTNQKSDELKNTNKEDMNKNQFEEKIKCEASLKKGRKHGDANNEPDPKRIVIISDKKEISSDQQNKNMLRDEEIEYNSSQNTQKRSGKSTHDNNNTHKQMSCSRHNRDATNNDHTSKIVVDRSKTTNVHMAIGPRPEEAEYGEVKNVKKRNDKDMDKNQYKDKNKQNKSLIDGSKQDNANNESDLKDNAISSCDEKKNATLVENIECTSPDATQEINDKVDKKSNKNNKSKSSDLCPNDSFNSDNITVNDYNKPNVISTEKTNDTIKKESNKIKKSMNNKSNISDQYSKGNCTDLRVSSNHEYLFKKAEHNKSKSKNALEDGHHGNTECLFDVIHADLFKLSNDFCLAHCVAEDLRMGAGIAVEFKRIFGSVGKLLDQHLKVGDVGIVERHNQHVFYLITKKKSSGKPTMQSLEKALYTLLEKMKQFKLTKLGIPQLGCGLDKLDWSDVSLLIKKIFAGSNIHITVCIPSNIEFDKKKTYPIKVFLTSTNIWNMETETVIIIFIDFGSIYKNDWTNNVVEEVNKRYPFKDNLLNDIKNKKLAPGNIEKYIVKNETIICAFTDQMAYYSSIEDAFLKINRAKNKKFIFSAIQINSIDSDVSDNNFINLERIVLIYRSIVRESELWLCGHTDQCKQIPYDQYSSQRRNSE